MCHCCRCALAPRTWLLLAFLGTLGLTALEEPNRLRAQPTAAGDKAASRLLRSARSGPWSEATTWEGGKVPGPGARVQVREGHAVVYDVNSDKVIRSLHV